MEENYEKLLNPKLYTLIRLDGHKFSKMVKIQKLQLPFDQKFNEAMIKTAEQGLQQFGFYLGYVGSDQITYYMPPVKHQLSELIYNGRTQKLISLLAGFISVAFNRNFNTKDYYFDCRIWQVYSLLDVYENFKDRRSSIIRNARMMLAQKHYSTKQLHGVGSKQAIKKLIEEKQIDFYELASEYNRIGRFIFKISVTETKEIKGKQVEVTRKKITGTTDVKCLNELLNQ